MLTNWARQQPLVAVSEGKSSVRFIGIYFWRDMGGVHFVDDMEYDFLV